MCNTASSREWAATGPPTLDIKKNTNRNKTTKLPFTAHSSTFYAAAIGPAHLYLHITTEIPRRCQPRTTTRRPTLLDCRMRIALTWVQSTTPFLLGHRWKVVSLSIVWRRIDYFTHAGTVLAEDRRSRLCFYFTALSPIPFLQNSFESLVVRARRYCTAVYDFDRNVVLAAAGILKFPMSV